MKILFLHTENDGLFDISHAERNYKWAGSTQKRLVRFARGSHNTIFGANMHEYLTAMCTVPEDRSARPPRWWHYPVAVILPILAAVPVVPVVVFLRQWLGIESFPGA